MNIPRRTCSVLLIVLLWGGAITAPAMALEDGAAPDAFASDVTAPDVDPVDVAAPAVVAPDVEASEGAEPSVTPADQRAEDSQAEVPALALPRPTPSRRKAAPRTQPQTCWHSGIDEHPDPFTHHMTFVLAPCDDLGVMSDWEIYRTASDAFAADEVRLNAEHPGGEIVCRGMIAGGDAQNGCSQPRVAAPVPVAAADPAVRCYQSGADGVKGPRVPCPDGTTIDQAGDSCPELAAGIRACTTPKAQPDACWAQAPDLDGWFRPAPCDVGSSFAELQLQQLPQGCYWNVEHYDDAVAHVDGTMSFQINCGDVPAVDEPIDAAAAVAPVPAPAPAPAPVPAPVPEPELVPVVPTAEAKPAAAAPFEIVGITTPVVRPMVSRPIRTADTRIDEAGSGGARSAGKQLHASSVHYAQRPLPFTGVSVIALVALAMSLLSLGGIAWQCCSVTRR